MARAHSRLARSFLSFGAVVVVACSDNGGNGRGYLGGEAGVVTCPVPSGDCPAVAPSYAKDVAPIFAAHCTGCHAPGRENADHPLTTYDDVMNNPTAGGLAHGCLMPPPPLPPLSKAALQTLDCWYGAGTPR